jgi:uncharacterized protein involved in outer membrane biogenesis
MVGIIIGAIFLLISGAGIAMMIIVISRWLRSDVKQLHRRSKRDFSGGLFSAVSGFTVSDVKISNFKAPKALEALKGNPVSDKDIFASMESFKFKVSIPPLLKKQFVLNELMLYTPQLNIVRYKSGAFNFWITCTKKEDS